jgi:hypothetical protein
LLRYERLAFARTDKIAHGIPAHPLPQHAAPLRPRV